MEKYFYTLFLPASLMHFNICQINYTSIADGSTNSTETDNYNITSLSIPVQPGTTYEVLVNSVSGDLRSTKQTYKMNSRK